MPSVSSIASITMIIFQAYFRMSVKETAGITTANCWLLEATYLDVVNQSMAFQLFSHL